MQTVCGQPELAEELKRMVEDLNPALQLLSSRLKLPVVATKSASAPFF
jgi:hypothetical protein